MAFDKEKFSKSQKRLLWMLVIMILVGVASFIVVGICMDYEPAVPQIPAQRPVDTPSGDITPTQDPLQVTRNTAAAKNYITVDDEEARETVKVFLIEFLDMYEDGNDYGFRCVRSVEEDERVKALYFATFAFDENGNIHAEYRDSDSHMFFDTNRVYYPRDGKKPDFTSNCNDEFFKRVYHVTINKHVVNGEEAVFRVSDDGNVSWMSAFDPRSNMTVELQFSGVQGLKYARAYGDGTWYEWYPYYDSVELPSDINQYYFVSA